MDLEKDVYKRQVEGVEVTDEEYDQFLQDNLEAAGFESEDDFKDYTGMSLEAVSYTHLDVYKRQI